MKTTRSRHPIALIDIGESFQTRNTEEKCVRISEIIADQEERGKKFRVSIADDAIDIKRTG